MNLATAAAQHEYHGTPATYTAENVLAEHLSPPLSEEVKVTLKVSQNLHASATPFIVKSILARGDSSKTGFDLEHDFLQRAGLDLGGAQQTDGAGGDARFSPNFMVHYLEYMSKQPSFESFCGRCRCWGRTVRSGTWRHHRRQQATCPRRLARWVITMRSTAGCCCRRRDSPDI